jgi:hypothetical protein
VAVEHAEAPCGHHEQRDAREQDAHQQDRELAGLAFEAWREDLHERGRADDAEQRDQRGDQRQQRADRARDPRGLRFATLGKQPRIDRDERGREHALTEQVLQEVRDAQRGPERIRRGGEAHVVGDRALADEAGDARQEDAGADRHRTAEASRRGWAGVRHGGDCRRRLSSRQASGNARAACLISTPHRPSAVVRGPASRTLRFPACEVTGRM